MVYLDPDDLRWEPYVKTWLQGFVDRMREATSGLILDLFTRYVDNGLKFVNKKCQQVIRQVSHHGYGTTDVAILF